MKKNEKTKTKEQLMSVHVQSKCTGFSQRLNFVDYISHIIHAA